MKRSMPGLLLILLFAATARADEPIQWPTLSDLDGLEADFSQTEFFFAPLAEAVLEKDAHAKRQGDVCPAEFNGCAGSNKCDALKKLTAACKKQSCACGKQCECDAGKAAADCACGATCPCAKNQACAERSPCSGGKRLANKRAGGTCACGAKCRCVVGKTAASCACGKRCRCAGAKQTVAACSADKCRCGAACGCGQKKIAHLQRELDAAYQHMEYQEHLARLQSETAHREHEMMRELMEAKATAAAHRAALEQQATAQHQQQELVSHLVELAHSAAHAPPVAPSPRVVKAPPVDHRRLQTRIEQLTIENVQLRKTIEELRAHIEQVAREQSETSR